MMRIENYSIFIMMKMMRNIFMILLKKKLLKGDKKNFTWNTVILDWFEANQEEIDNILESGNIHYIKDILK